MALLAELPLADCPSTRAIRALHTFFPHGDHTGQALGIAQADNLSGNLTLAFTMLTLDDTGCQGRFDSRTPLCGTDETIRQVTQAAMAQAGFYCAGGRSTRPTMCPRTPPFSRSWPSAMRCTAAARASAWPSAEAPTSTTSPAA